MDVRRVTTYSGPIGRWEPVHARRSWLFLIALSLESLSRWWACHAAQMNGISGRCVYPHWPTGIFWWSCLCALKSQIRLIPRCRWWLFPHTAFITCLQSIKLPFDDPFAGDVYRPFIWTVVQRRACDSETKHVTEYIVDPLCLYLRCAPGFRCILGHPERLQSDELSLILVNID